MKVTITKTPPPPPPPDIVSIELTLKEATILKSIAYFSHTVTRLIEKESAHDYPGMSTMLQDLFETMISANVP